MTKIATAARPELLDEPHRESPGLGLHPQQSLWVDHQVRRITEYFVCSAVGKSDTAVPPAVLRLPSTHRSKMVVVGEGFVDVFAPVSTPMAPVTRRPEDLGNAGVVQALDGQIEVLIRSGGVCRRRNQKSAFPERVQVHVIGRPVRCIISTHSSQKKIENMNDVQIYARPRVGNQRPGATLQWLFEHCSEKA